MAQKLDQQGISIFEIAIITLTVLLVVASCIIVAKHVDKSSKENYEKTKIMEPDHEN